MSWFKRVKEGILTSTKDKKEVPEGLWTKCPVCKKAISSTELVENNYVCTNEDRHHFRVGSEVYFRIIFDENEYVANASFNSRSLESLSREFAAVRIANIHFFKALSEEEYSRTGIASNNPVSVRALLYILVGHVNHHRKILEERYL